MFFKYDAVSDANRACDSHDRDFDFVKIAFADAAGFHFTKGGFFCSGHVVERIRKDLPGGKEGALDGDFLDSGVGEG